MSQETPIKSAKPAKHQKNYFSLVSLFDNPDESWENLCKVQNIDFLEEEKRIPISVDNPLQNCISDFRLDSLIDDFDSEVKLDETWKRNQIEMNEIISQKEFLKKQKNDFQEKHRHQKNDIESDDDDDENLQYNKNLIKLTQRIEDVQRKRKRKFIDDPMLIQKRKIFMDSDDDDDDDDDETSSLDDVWESSSLAFMSSELFQVKPQDYYSESFIANHNYNPEDIINATLKSKNPQYRLTTFNECLSKFLGQSDLHTRKFEDGILRTPFPGTTERPCRSGTNCIGYKQFKDILVECLTQKEYKLIEEKNEFPINPGLCLRCRRYNLGMLYEKYRATQENIPFDTFCSNYYNLTQQAGEYFLENGVVSPRDHYTGFPLPIIMDNPNGMSRKVVELPGGNGVVVYHQQIGYPIPTVDDLENDSIDPKTIKPLFAQTYNNNNNNNETYLDNLIEFITNNNNNNICPEWLKQKTFSRKHRNFLENIEFPWRPLRYLKKPTATTTTIINDNTTTTTTDTTITNDTITSGTSDIISDDAYSIYIELCNRIAYYNSLAKIYSEQVIYRALDECIPLSIYMDRTHFYSDRELLSHEEFYYLLPRKLLVFSPEVLPNLSMHAIFCNYWGNTINQSDLYFRNNLDKIFTFLLSKAFPAPCKRREFHIIIAKESIQENGRYIHDSLSRLIAASLLGIYHHCIHKTNFWIRREIYEWYLFQNEKKEDLQEWIKNNKTLFTYIMRETLFNVIENIYFLEDTMNQLYVFWNSMKKNTFDALDAIRDFYNNNKKYQQNSGNEIELYVEANKKQTLRVRIKKQPKFSLEMILSEFNQRNLKISPKPMLFPFQIYALNVFEKLGYNNIKVKGVQQPNIKIDDPRVEKIIITLRKMRPTIHDPILEITYDYLIIFGVSLEKTLLPLKEAEFLYRSEADRTKIKKLIYYLRKERPQDFYLLKIHFDTIHYLNNIQIFSLPKHIKKKQIRTLKKIFGQSNEETLPPSAGNILICETCGYPKMKILFDVNRRGKDSKLPVYDAFTGKSHCKKIVERNQIMKKKAKGTLLPESTYRLSNHYNCKYTELTQVNLIGKLIWSSNQGSVFLCPDCCKPTSYSPEIFLRSGALKCGCKSKNNRNNRNIRQCVVCKKPKGEIKKKLVIVDSVGPRLVGFCSKHPMNFIERENRLLYLSEIKNYFLNNALKTIRNSETDEIYHIQTSNNFFNYPKIWENETTTTTTQDNENETE